MRLRNHCPQPQSNQRGIETTSRPSPPPTGGSSLNRTSVGLKRSWPSESPGRGSGPQSNQRGIETCGASHCVHPAPTPQSNQRGIETSSRMRSLSCQLSGLNRTSVGLKQASRSRRRKSHRRPQSNQRGIETRFKNPRHSLLLLCLNRTSVGLKLPTLPMPSWCREPPQSNQRGIETTTQTNSLTAVVFASIEPAWD